MTIRFNLASNLSSIDISTQEVGESEWTPVETTVTGEGDDTRDIRFPVKTENTIMRAECFVDAMGRAVIFFITVDNYTTGNTTDYAEMTEADAAQTASDTSSAVSADDLLDSVEGLTVGGTGTASVTDASAAAASMTESAQTAAEQENTVQSATLILATGTWWRIFLTAFCGSFLAGLVLRGFTLLTDAIFKGKKKSASSRKARYADDPDDDENDSILTDGLWGDDDES